jgi:hypothetical protein
MCAKPLIRVEIGPRRALFPKIRGFSMGKREVEPGVSWGIAAHFLVVNRDLRTKK